MICKAIVLSWIALTVSVLLSAQPASAQITATQQKQHAAARERGFAQLYRGVEDLGAL